MIEYINKVILPYVNEKRRDLKLGNEQPALLIFDNFKAQCTTSVLSLLDQYHINVASIPPNCRQAAAIGFKYKQSSKGLSAWSV